MYQALPSVLHIKDSPIAGQGLFAKVDISAGTSLGMSHIILDEVIHRTPLGGFTNHSDDPNCIKLMKDNKYYMMTCKDIKAGEELFLKYTFYTI